MDPITDPIAIDVHVHLCDELTLSSKGDRPKQMAEYFKRERKPVSIDEMADQYRERNMMAVIQNTTDETITGLTPVPNKHVADGVQRNPDVFLGFGVIDPWQQKVALQEIRRIKDLGLHGVGEINPRGSSSFPTTPASTPCGRNARSSNCRSCSTAAWPAPAPAPPGEWATSSSSPSRFTSMTWPRTSPS